MITPRQLLLYWLMKWLKIGPLVGNIHIRDWAELDIIHPDGSIDKILVPGQENTITQAGLAEVAGLVGNTGSPTAFTYLAVGTDNTAESNAHTALQAEITTGGLARASATVSRVTTTHTNDTLQLLHEWTASAGHSVEEAGAFNAASSGDMLGRKVTGTVTIANADHLKLTYKFAFS